MRNLSTIPFSNSTGTVIHAVAGSMGGGTAGNYYQYILITAFVTEVVLENENFADSSRWPNLGTDSNGAVNSNGQPLNPADITVYDSDVAATLRNALKDKYYAIQPTELAAPTLVYKNLGNVLLEQRDK